MTSMSRSEQPAIDTATPGLHRRPKIESITAVTARIGEQATRLGLVVVIAWIGAMKFTPYEAEAIAGLVANSPLMSWAYAFLDVRALSTALGVVELLIACSLAAGVIVPRAGVAGGVAATAMFLTTLSFLVTTPGAFEPSLGGFPALSVVPGQFLVKDAVLLGASVWLTARSLQDTKGVRS